MKYLSIFIRVALLALGQSLDCHSASEVSLMDMGKSVNVKPQQSTAKQKPCAYFLGYTVSVWTVQTETHLIRLVNLTLILDTDRLFHAPARTTSSGCFMLHRTVHAIGAAHPSS